jgi:hypothetical protein
LLGCWVPSAGVPGVVSFSVVAFIHAVAGVSALDVVPVVDSVFAVASFPMIL